MKSLSYYDGASERVGEQWNVLSNVTFLQPFLPDETPSMPGLTPVEVGLNVSLNLPVNVTWSGDFAANDTVTYEIRDALWIVIPISIIYSTIFVIGVLGNVITCIVISRNKSMHTATNYYLFSLAISDLLLLVTGVPLDIYRTWYRYPYPFGTTVCKIAGFAAETSANATVLTITAFTVERYVAICKPFLSHTMSKLSRAVRFVLAIWLIAVSLAVPQALAMQIDEQFLTCTVRHEPAKHLFFISTVLVFVFPMNVITILYILIWLQLRRSKVVRFGTQRGSSVLLKHSIFKRSSHRTVVTLHSDRTDTPDLHYSESALISPLQQPRSTDALRAPPTSPLLQHTNSCPATPERQDRANSDEQPTARQHRALHQQVRQQHHRRSQSLAQYRYGATGSPVKGSASAGGSHQQLEQALSGGSEDGRINYSNRTQYNSTRHVVKMLVAVVIAFFLCWAPFHAQRLMAVYANEYNANDAIRMAFDILTHVSGILYYISTCINPVLYNIMSLKFREAFKETLSNYFYPRSSQPLSEELFFRNASWRSNSNNSHSLNTCSSGGMSHATESPRGPGAERRVRGRPPAITTTTTTTSSSIINPCSSAVPLRCPRRPLVVSFRTRKRPLARSNAPEVIPTAASRSDGSGRPQRNDPMVSHRPIRPTGDNEPGRRRKADGLCLTGRNGVLAGAVKGRLAEERCPAESDRTGVERHQATETQRKTVCGYDRSTVQCQYDLFPELRWIYSETTAMKDVRCLAEEVPRDGSRSSRPDAVQSSPVQPDDRKLAMVKKAR
ncbi:D(3) dopamine receptor-like [Anopheles nili]|uniref:D(3) dopamine receptor-like n=1 Tax=Anopheles nili TaxID=185578 RepID=UPI00237AFEB9|nr:D(3) dopamine receptor-like [Anopheles nili]